jgi:mRNA-degrading endonuclease toxin of MazEF toxin-antitoxin module
MKESLLKMKQISSFDKRRFIKLIGIADQETMTNMNKHLQLFIGG